MFRELERWRKGAGFAPVLVVAHAVVVGCSESSKSSLGKGAEEESRQAETTGNEVTSALGNATSGGGVAVSTALDGQTVSGTSGEASADPALPSGQSSATLDVPASSGSDASGVDSSGETMDPGAHCTPGEPFVVYPPGRMQSCQGDLARDHRLPSVSIWSVSNIELEAPTTAGEQFAFSFESSGGFSEMAEGHAGEWPLFIEIWGTHELCGAAERLLWWGPQRDGIVCGEFTPDAAYSHLLYVSREARDFSGGWSTDRVTTCNAGRCPAGADGEGVAPGITLNPPLIYDAPMYETRGLNYEITFGSRGHMLLLVDAEQPVGTPNPLTKGYFRMPGEDRFGDGWYCVGAGSSLTENVEGENHVVSLKNVTRLPHCDQLTGNQTAEFAISAEDFTLSSSFPDLQSDAPYSGTERFCDGTLCVFQLMNLTTSALDRRLYLDLASSVGNWTAPISTPTGILAAWLFHEPDPTLPIHATCTSTGTITYDPEQTTKIGLEAMTEYFTCPGEPIEEDTFEFELINRF